MFTTMEPEVPLRATSIESKPTNKLPTLLFHIVALSFGPRSIRDSGSLYTFKKGGGSGFCRSGILIKLGIDYGVLASSPLDCGFQMG